MNRKIRLWKGPYFFLLIRKEQLVFQKKIIYNKHDVTYGAIAQLGERYAGSVEVRGSSPLGSIPVNPYSIRVFLFVRNRANYPKKQLGTNWGPKFYFGVI